ncbi:MAG: glycosyltransferase family 2 protein [Ignavibacteria bacterium]|nr:glycosyltransferase family 2 protein [Ignavibacteria bacterium]
MQTFLTYTFFALILLVINSYILYPVFIYILSILFKKKIEISNESYPQVSILISAYNEEKVIEKRVQNILNSNYDMDKIEILVGSDCSNDRTNEILKNLENAIPQLRVFIFNARRGKAGVLNDLVDYARNEILIFTDANTEFHQDAIKKMVQYFNDKRVGGVSGRLELVETHEHIKEGVEEKRYWQYETILKKSEGKLGILIGANGGIFAIRKSLFVKVPLDKPVTDDFFISLNVIKQGYWLIYEPEAVAFEYVARDVKTEFRRKVRFAATNFQTISFFRDLLFNKNIILSYAFWSHKIIRWFLPFILILLFIVNVLIFEQHLFFKYLLYLQVIVYGLGLIGYLFSKIKIRIGIISLISYFLITNLALLIGYFKFLRKKHSLIWQSTPR